MYRSNDLYYKIIGLKKPWYIEKIELDDDISELKIFLEYHSKEAPCPICNKMNKIYDFREERKWRHLDTCQYKTYIYASVPRIKCEEHSVKTIKVPWSSTNNHFTHLFESLAIEMIKCTKNKTKASEFLRISFSQIHTIMENAVKRGLERRNKNTLEYIGIDEKSMKKGHHYFTVVSDLKDNKVLDIVEKRTSGAVNELLIKIKSCEDTTSLKGITMDMWKPYINVSAEVFPDTDKIHDRFHLKKYLNDAVDKTRKVEARKFEKDKIKTLKNTKYMFLKNKENLTDYQKVRFAEIKAMNLETSKAWLFKDIFDTFFDITCYENAKKFFYEWIDDVNQSSLLYLKKVALMFDKHSQGILNYIKHKITNSLAENINGKIQLIKATARGFKAFKNYRIAVLFHLGKLDLLP